MKLIKMNIFPITLYVCVGILLLVSSLLPSLVITWILRVCGTISIATPFVILTWLIARDFINMKHDKS